ncbi:MAG: hypothetical protein Kapaf2KO_16840 [Candidatus Kapaibacteriales bacterium]
MLLKRASFQKYYPDAWQVVTGKIELVNGRKETFVEASIREMKEETGLSPVTIYNIPYVAVFSDHFINTIQHAPVIGIEVDCWKECQISNEHQDFTWLNVNEANNRLDIYSHKIGAKIFEEEVLLNKNKIYNLDF